jgi:membrane-bound ClpP family serine protease
MTKEVTMKNIKENTRMIGIMTGSTHLTTNNIMALKIVIVKTATKDNKSTHNTTNIDMVIKTITTDRPHSGCPFARLAQIMP